MSYVTLWRVPLHGARVTPVQAEAAILLWIVGVNACVKGIKKCYNIRSVLVFSRYIPQLVLVTSKELLDYLWITFGYTQGLLLDIHTKKMTPSN